MFLYRITKKQFANLDGAGGLLVSGRWHEKGNRVLYFSESRSLALLEFMVHLDSIELLPEDLVFMSVLLPESVDIKEITINDLGSDWKNEQYLTREKGTMFLKEKGAVILKIPSVVVPKESNFIVNPLHPDISKLEITSIENVEMDSRLLESLKNR